MRNLETAHLSASIRSLDIIPTSLIPGQLSCALPTASRTRVTPVRYQLSSQAFRRDQRWLGDHLGDATLCCIESGLLARRINQRLGRQHVSLDGITVLADRKSWSSIMTDDRIVRGGAPNFSSCSSTLWICPKFWADEKRGTDRWWKAKKFYVQRTLNIFFHAKDS